MNDRPFVYLACPYVHEERVVREARFVQVSKAAAHLMNQGHIVFSPITHGHPMAVNGGLPTGWQFWERVDKAFLQHCHTIVVLPIEGWRESKGLMAELKYARENNIEILYLDPETLEIDWSGPPPKTKIDRL